MKVKYILLSLALIPQLMFPDRIVHDPLQYNQKEMQWIEKLKQWEQQLKFYKQQIELLTGHQKYGTIAQQIAANLPQQWNDYMPNSRPDLLHTEAINHNKSDFLLKNFTLMVNTYNDSKIRLERIEQIIDQINNAVGTKEAADLNNRLQAEALMMQEGQNRLQSLNQMMQYEEKLSDHQIWLKRMCKSKKIHNQIDPRVPIPEECIIYQNNAPSQGAGTVQANSEQVWKNKNWRLGQTSEQYESSGNGPGTINGAEAAADDKGGWSYGKYQIATNTGTMNQYLKTSKYKNELKGLKPGTKEFNKKWEEIAKRDPKGFSEDQHKFIQKTHYEKQMNLLKKNGIDLSNRGPAIQDLVWSSSVQHGGNTPVIQRALKGKDVSRMSNDQIIDAIQNQKIQRTNKKVKNIKQKRSLLNRISNERNSLHQLELKSKQRKENL